MCVCVCVHFKQNCLHFIYTHYIDLCVLPNKMLNDRAAVGVAIASIVVVEDMIN